MKANVGSRLETGVPFRASKSRGSILTRFVRGRYSTEQSAEHVPLRTTKRRVKKPAIDLNCFSAAPDTAAGSRTYYRILEVETIKSISSILNNSMLTLAWNFKSRKMHKIIPLAKNNFYIYFLILLN